MGKVVTIDDIAKKAGVGKGTVDRVIHNRGRVSDETRERVLKCIEELGYVPNKTARMLARKGSYRIAAVFHDAEAEFWTQVKRGIDKAAAEYEAFGVKLDYFLLPMTDSGKQAEIIREVTEKRYDGMAIVPYCTDEVSDGISAAVRSGVEVVAFNNKDKRGQCCYIGHDGLQSGRTAGGVMSLLGKEGCRFAIFTAEGGLMQHLDERCTGFLEVIAEKRKDMDCVDTFSYREQDAIRIYQIACQFLSKHAGQLDAVYVTTSHVNSMARAIQAMGLEHSVFLVGHDLTEDNVRYLHDGAIDVLIGQDPQRQGYAAVEAICKKLLMGEEIPRCEYTEISIVISENAGFRKN